MTNAITTSIQNAFESPLAPSCVGWTFWHYEKGGEVEPVDAARALYRLASED